MKLKGRTALVTGSSRGIGRAVALALAEEGADVAVNYVSSEAGARDVVDHVRKMGRNCFGKLPHLIIPFVAPRVNDEEAPTIFW